MSETDGRKTTTIEVDNPTDEPIVVVGTMAGFVSDGKFTQTKPTELHAYEYGDSTTTWNAPPDPSDGLELAFARRPSSEISDGIRAGDVEVIREWTEDDYVCHSELGRAALRGLLNEIDRLRRYKAALIAYGHALIACDAASNRDGDAEYEADVAMEKAFDEIVEVSKSLAEKEDAS